MSVTLNRLPKLYISNNSPKTIFSFGVHIFNWLVCFYCFYLCVCVRACMLACHSTEVHFILTSRGSWIELRLSVFIHRAISIALDILTMIFFVEPKESSLPFCPTFSQLLTYPLGGELQFVFLLVCFFPVESPQIILTLIVSTRQRNSQRLREARMVREIEGQYLWVKTEGSALMGEKPKVGQGHVLFFGFRTLKSI